MSFCHCCAHMNTLWILIFKQLDAKPRLIKDNKGQVRVQLRVHFSQELSTSVMKHLLNIDISRKKRKTINKCRKVSVHKSSSHPLERCLQAVEGLDQWGQKAGGVGMLSAAVCISCNQTWQIHSHSLLLIVFSVGHERERGRGRETFVKQRGRALYLSHAVVNSILAFWSVC